MCDKQQSKQFDPNHNGAMPWRKAYGKSAVTNKAFRLHYEGLQNQLIAVEGSTRRVYT
jgi:hypothetical protein